jgi:hypothetical protein
MSRTTVRAVSLAGALVGLALSGCGGAFSPSKDKDAPLDAKKFNEVFLASNGKASEEIEAYGKKLAAAAQSKRAEDFAEARKAYSQLLDVLTTLWVEWKAVKPPRLESAQNLHAVYLRYLEKSEETMLTALKEISALLEDEEKADRSRAEIARIAVRMVLAVSEEYEPVKQAHRAFVEECNGTPD